MRAYRVWKTVYIAFFHKGSPWLLGWVALFMGCHPRRDLPANVLRIGLMNSYSSLDPIYARDQLSVWLVQQIFSGLVGYDSLLRPVPALAERWEISEGGKKYRFHLRKGVQYHYQPNRFLRAADVLYSWHRLAHPKWSSPGSYLFRGIIAGWEAYQRGDSPSIQGLKAIGDSIVEITLTAPYGPFLHLLTLPYAMVVLPELAESLGRDFGKHPIGCGPFALEYHETGRLLVLKRWVSARPPYVQKLVFRWYPNRLWAWEALQRGEIDAFEGTDRALDHLLSHRQVNKTKAYRIETPQLGTEYIGMDVQRHPPFREQKFRKALRYLIWQMPLTGVVLRGHATPARTFIPPLLLSHLPDVDRTPPDTQTLAQLQTLSLRLYAPPTFRELCEYIQSQLGQQGIQLQIEYLLGPSLREYISKGQIALWKASWLADFPDGENFLILFESHQHVPTGPNTTRYANKKVDSLISHSRHIPQEELRRELYTIAESLISAEAPVIPLYHAHGIWTLHPRVKGFPRSALPVWLPLQEVQIQ
ncbi:MAG: ABC transporter substrate-binding protein [Bacteroidia bacterium]|nr:ABC transporter substrate-binding protein [Bacteroidia bacterium]